MPRLHGLLWVFLALSLTACRASSPAPPTPFPTGIPDVFVAPDLSGLLLDRSLLPPGATSAEVQDRPHPSLVDLPEPDFFTSAWYLQGAAFAGRLSIFMYARETDLDAAWPRLLDVIYTPREVSGIGDLAAVDHSDIAFIRCQALVHIKLAGAHPDELRTFAEKLDAKLTPLVCSQEE